MDTGSFDKLINRIIDKKYKIESAVGIGGMAYVLKAKDLSTGRDVAIKLLNDEFKDDERAVKRFINESKTVSMLNHDNIVKIHDIVINIERKYIVMEFIDGITLKDYTDKIGALGWKEAIHYIRQVLSALDHAHEKLVIHRDIKPQNIMLLPDGKVKVTDFGIAKLPNAESITMTDKAIGTVNYISPEQASGSAIDARTDIYSVGVMLYELVTGRLPFIADSPVAVAMMQVSNEPLAPREINPQIPIGLEQIILKAMQKKSEDRFVSAAAMLKALNYFANNPEIIFAGSASTTGASGAKLKKSDYEDEEKKKRQITKKKRGSRSMFPIVAGISTAALVVIAILTYPIWGTFFGLYKNTSGSFDNISQAGADTIDSLLIGNNNSKKITIESFVGKEFNEQLIKEIEEKGYEIIPDYDVYPQRTPNTIVRQNPAENSLYTKPENGEPIPLTLYINTREGESVMPDCTLLYVNTAKTVISQSMGKLIEANFPSDTINVVKEFHDTYPADYVIRTEPAAGDIIEADSIPEITIYVSRGQKISNTTVPALEGITLEEAKRSIIESKLSLGRIYYEESETVQAGKVIKAKHANKDLVAGDKVAAFITGIDLWVSIGSSTPIPEVTPSPMPVTPPPVVSTPSDEPDESESRDEPEEPVESDAPATEESDTAEETDSTENPDNTGLQNQENAADGNNEHSEDTSESNVQEEQSGEQDLENLQSIYDNQ